MNYVTWVLSLFFRLNEIGSRLSVNDTHRETLSKGLTTVKDELTDLVTKVDNMTLDVKDVQSESNVQKKMLESQIAQWVSCPFFPKDKCIAFV